MGAPQIDEVLAARLYKRAKAERWRLPSGEFARALESSAARVPGGETARAGDLERYLVSLHLEDLALACACAVGDEAAWEHVVREFRPLLYR